MICSHCKKMFSENLIHESHDVPCYLFFIEAIKRRDRKQHADKHGRRLLCKGCHDNYEIALRDYFIEQAVKFSKRYFDDTKSA